jgi:hypothetical protein
MPWRIIQGGGPGTWKKWGNFENRHGKAIVFGRKMIKNMKWAKTTSYRC